MRGLFGSFFVLLFISCFTVLFLFTAQEVEHAQSFHSFLDEEIDIHNIDLKENSVIYDRHGDVISDIYNGENRIHLTFDEIPQVVIDALLAAEDQSFYEHQGFDVQGMARALLVNLSNQSIEQGGSTVTQQLVRNIFLSHDQTYERKLTELIYAYQLERHFTKEEIIELYVNAIYFQNGAYGIEAAAKLYFNKRASELTLSETAFLCAIPNRPHLFDPFVNIEKTHERKEWILAKMLEMDVIDLGEYEDALEAKIMIERYERIDKYPDYVTYVYDEFTNLVAEHERYYEKLKNASSAEAKQEIEERLNNRVNEIFNQGITIHTSLDPVVQQTAVNNINQFLGEGLLQGAATIIDHQQNEIVAITGGKNYRKFNFHRGFQAYRQPGSAIKPLLVFAPFIEKTNTNEKAVVDASPFNRGGYSPKNYGGAVYGNVLMEEAFKHSYNTAAVRMFDMTGISTSFSYIDMFDFSKITAEDHTLPAALGGFTHGVSVLEMTQAYSVFSTDGTYHSPKAIREVTDKNGNVIYSWNQQEKNIWSTQTVAQIRKMMTRVVTEGTGRRANFTTSGYLGGKTGTTNDYNDLWFVGSSSKYTTGLWLGTDENNSIRYASDSNYHTQLWRRIMENIH